MEGATQLPSFLRERPRTRAAFELAASVHAEQERQADAAPFILHPLEVAAALDLLGFDDEVTAAAVLHDTLEETELTAEQIQERFGAHVAAIVDELTDDEGIDDERERKAALRAQVADAGHETAAIFAADKVSKARELRIRLRCAEDLDQPEVRLKLDHYRRSLEMLEAKLDDHALVRQLRFELEALQALPPRRRLRAAATSIRATGP